MDLVLAGDSVSLLYTDTTIIELDVVLPPYEHHMSVLALQVQFACMLWQEMSVHILCTWGCCCHLLKCQA